MQVRLLWVVLALSAITPGCRESPRSDERSSSGVVTPPDDRPLLTEITDDVGLGLTDEPWSDCSYAAPEIMGPGVGLLDYDGDDDLDILQLRMPRPDRPDGPAPNRLFQQQPDGTFEEVASAGLEDPGFAQGVAVGDADVDGDLDVYFANYGPDTFYVNNGDGTFRNATGEAGIYGNLWSSGATFCDIDGDGDLDLYVVHYLDFNPKVRCIGAAGVRDYCSPDTFFGVPDRLYVNNGDGTFTDASGRLGLVYGDRGRAAKGLAVLCTDFTDDGRLDFYVANDREANNLWVQQPDGTFRDEAVLRGVAVNRYGKPEASMGLTVGDADGDGGLDLFVTHLQGENNTLYGKAAEMLYRDRTTDAGMGVYDWPLTGFGTGFFDFDHDGDRDLALVNGRVRHGPPLPGAKLGALWNQYAQPNLLFENDGTGRFENVSARSAGFGQQIEVTRGLGFGDLDGDGDLDLLLSNADNSLRLFRNDAPESGRHWLMVRATTSGGVDALGARLTLVSGERRWIGWVLRGYSYQSSNDPHVHFGLGETDRVDALEAIWPDGTRERFAVDGVDRVVTVHQGQGERP